LGGGNQFARNLTEALQENEHEVYFDLKYPNLDIILMIDPRLELGHSTIGDQDIINYKKSRPEVVVIHRFNECDERKNTIGVNERIIWANRCADHSIFVSSWLRDLYLKDGWNCSGELESSVILNGSDKKIFRDDFHQDWNGQKTVSLVTHHWGNHWKKGFDIYQKLDQLLEDSEWRERIDFSYIGRMPEGFQFKNAKHLKPMSGEALSRELQKHDIYVTGSLDEPGSNHQNEGAFCGLPLLYIEQGSMPEYCDGFGVPFTEDNFEEKLEVILKDYSTYRVKIKDYPFSSKQCCDTYLELFKSLVAQKQGKVLSIQTRIVENLEISDLNPISENDLKLSQWISGNTEICNISLEQSYLELSNEAQCSLFGLVVSFLRSGKQNLRRSLTDFKHYALRGSSPFQDWFVQYIVSPNERCEQLNQLLFYRLLLHEAEGEIPEEAEANCLIKNLEEANSDTISRLLPMHLLSLLNQQEAADFPVLDIKNLVQSNGYPYTKNLHTIALYVYGLSLLEKPINDSEVIIDFVLLATPEQSLQEIEDSFYVLYRCGNDNEYRKDEVLLYMELCLSLAKKMQRNTKEDYSLSLLSSIYSFYHNFCNISSGSTRAIYCA